MDKLLRRERDKARAKEKRATRPWCFTWVNARSRCNNPKHPKYDRYGRRGIKCLMTQEDFKTLWFRDKAYLMKKPTIDRKDNDGHYIIGNCEYVEVQVNIQRRGYSLRHRRKLSLGALKMHIRNGRTPRLNMKYQFSKKELVNVD